MGVKSGIILFFVCMIFLVALISFFADVGPEEEASPEPGGSGTATPAPSGQLSPARDLTGDWSGTASFREDVEGAQCLFTGVFYLRLQQEGNDVGGDFSFTETSVRQTRLPTDSGVPAVGCSHPDSGVTSGQVYGSVSSSAIYLGVGGRPQFSGSFTTDLMSLRLEKCLVQDACTVANPAQWTITLTRQG